MENRSQKRISLSTLALLVLMLFSSRTGLAQAKEYIEEVFKIVEKHSLKRDSLDFEKIRKDAFAQLSDTKSISECYPVVRFILSELKDHHSLLMEKADVDKWKSTSKLDATPLGAFKGKLIPDKIGVIEMQGFSSGDSVSISDYARSLQELIASLDNKKLKGWILDLRQNTGGNCWPMLAGLGPLLGDGICGYFIDNVNNKVAWYYKDKEGISGSDSIVHCRINAKPYYLIHADRPIAVLTGSWTASSGEVVVTAFKGKNNTKSFGMETGGYSTGNADYNLSDGSMLFLTTSVYADRKGHSYGGKISPDVSVPFDYNQLNKEDDPVIKEAVKWIKAN